MKISTIMKNGATRVGATFAVVLALVLGISIPANADTGIGYGSGTGGSAGGSVWEVSVGWGDFVARSGQTESFLNTRIASLRSDGSNLLWQCQNSQVIWWLKFRPDGRWWGLDPAYYVGGFTPDYPAQQMQSPGPQYLQNTIAAQLAVARRGNPTTQTVIICSRDVDADLQWQTQRHTGTKTNHYSNTFFGPANLNTQVTRQVLQGSTSDPVGPANLHDQPLSTVVTPFGQFLAGLTEGTLNSQTAYNTINGALMAAPYNAVRTGDDPMNPNAVTYRVNTSQDRPDVALDEENIKGLAEGGVLNISQFDDYGYITTTQDDTFSYDFTWRCAAQPGRAWPGVNADGTLRDGSAVRIVANQSAAESSANGGFAGWSCYVSAGTKPTNFDVASVENSWTLNDQQWNLKKAPTSQLSSAFYQIMTVHCNIDEFNDLLAELGVEGVDYEILEQAIGKDHTITAMIRTKVYTSGEVTPPDNPAGKRAYADQLESNWQAAQALADAQVTLANSRELAATNAEAAAEAMKPENHPSYVAAETAATNATNSFNSSAILTVTQIDQMRSAVVQYKDNLDALRALCIGSVPPATATAFNTAYGNGSSRFIQAYENFMDALEYVPGVAPDNVPSFDRDAIIAARDAFNTEYNLMKTAATDLIAACPGATSTSNQIVKTHTVSSAYQINSPVYAVDNGYIWVGPMGVMWMNEAGTVSVLSTTPKATSAVDAVWDSANNILYVPVGGGIDVYNYDMGATSRIPLLGLMPGNVSLVLDGSSMYLFDIPLNRLYTVNLTTYAITQTTLPSALFNVGPGYVAKSGNTFYGRKGGNVVSWQIGAPAGTTHLAFGNIIWVESVHGKIHMSDMDGLVRNFAPPASASADTIYTGAMNDRFFLSEAPNGQMIMAEQSSGWQGNLTWVAVAPQNSTVVTNYNTAVTNFENIRTTFNTQMTSYTTALNAARVATCNYETIGMVGTLAAYPACNNANTTAPGTMDARSTVAQNCMPNDSYTCRSALALSLREDATNQRTEATRLTEAANELRLLFENADQVASEAESSTWGYSPADPVLRGMHRDLGDASNPSPAKARTGYVGFYDKECSIDCISVPTMLDNSHLQQALADAIAAEDAARVARDNAAAALDTANGQVGTRQGQLATAETAYHTARANAVNAANALKNYINEVPAASGGNTYRSLPSNGNTSSAAAGNLVTAINTYTSYYGSSTTVRANPSNPQSTNLVSLANEFIDGTPDSVTGDTSALVANANTSQGAGTPASNCGSNAKIQVCLTLQQTGQVDLANNRSVVQVTATIRNNSNSYHCDNMPNTVSGSGIVNLAGGIPGLRNANQANCVNDSSYIVYHNTAYWVTHNAARAGSVSQSFGFSFGNVNTSGQFGSASTSVTLSLRTLPPASISVRDALGAQTTTLTNAFLNTNTALATAYTNYTTASNNYANAVASQATATANLAAAENAYALAQIATQEARDALDRAPQTATGETVTVSGGSYAGNRALFNATPNGNLQYKDELGGVLIDKDTTDPVTNSNYLEVFRDNNTHRLTVNVTYPDSTSKVTDEGEYSLVYRGEAPVTTTVVLWNMSTPNTTPAASQFLISAADSSGVSRAQLLTGSADPSTVSQRNFSRPGAYDTYNGLLATSVAGFYNDFNISGTWSSTRTRPVVLNVKWEFQPVNRVTVPTLVGFTSNLAVEPNSQPVQVEQPIDVRCYAAFGEHDAFNIGDATVFPSLNADGQVSAQNGTYADVIRSYTGTGAPNILDSQLIQGPRNEDIATVRAANPGQNFNYSFPHDTTAAEIASGMADPDTLRASADGDLAYRMPTNLVLKFIRSVAN